jgi:hypothetical protein
MDFADATSMHLATEKPLSMILIIDHDTFEAYSSWPQESVSSPRRAS